MKGVIFTELADLVGEQFGLETLDHVIESVDSATGCAYTAVGTYPDQELYDLVGALSEKTGIEAGDLLRAFGRHLFGRLATLYPEQVKTVSNCFDLLESLENVIHPNVQKLYPDAVLPSFVATRLDNGDLEMNYDSPRGLPDLAVGLIEGCGDWFGEQLTVHQESISSDGKQAVFRISRSN